MKRSEGKIRISRISTLRDRITHKETYGRLFPLAWHQRAIAISIRRETTTSEHRGLLRTPMRVRRCLVNRTKCGEDFVRGWLWSPSGNSRGLSAKPRSSSSWPNRRQESDYSTNNV